MFFSVVSVAVFQRCVLRANAAGETLLPPLSAITRRVLGVAGLTFTVIAAGGAVYYRWVRPPLALGGTQPGFGPRVRRLGGGGDRLHPRRARRRAAC